LKDVKDFKLIGRKTVFENIAFVQNVLGLARAEQKKRDKRLRKIDEEIADLESRIASAERERERNDLLLCSEEVFRDGERSRKIQSQNADLKAMIDLLSGKWEVLAREKEELEGVVA